MNKESILSYLADIKRKYQNKGFLIKTLFGSYSSATGKKFIIDRAIYV
ncbi:MAG: hypothetical protein U9N33_09225 [Campylobacterota bacterium]|nr:hypothetical protein [Campylobacterota bacterium]